MLTFTPGPVVSFKECYIGEHTDLVCTLQNECDVLPVTFVFHKIAHYNICPEKGKIKGKSVKVFTYFLSFFILYIYLIFKIFHVRVCCITKCCTFKETVPFLGQRR